MSERIVVIGAGPIGGIIGGRLARAGANITFVDVDTDHIRAIRESGLHVDVPDGPFDVPIEIVVPYARQRVVGEAHAACRVVSETHDEAGTRLVVRARPEVIARLLHELPCVEV